MAQKFWRCQKNMCGVISEISTVSHEDAIPYTLATEEQHE